MTNIAHQHAIQLPEEFSTNQRTFYPYKDIPRAIKTNCKTVWTLINLFQLFIFSLQRKSFSTQIHVGIFDQVNCCHPVQSGSQCVLITSHDGLSNLFCTSLQRDANKYTANHFVLKPFIMSVLNGQKFIHFGVLKIIIDINQRDALF